MPKARALGNAAAAITSQAIQRLAANQQVLFDAVLLINAGDKEAAIRALKPIADNNTVVLQALMLMRAGELEAAQDVLFDAMQQRGLSSGQEPKP